MVCEKGGRGCSRLLSGLTPRYPEVCVAVGEGSVVPRAVGPRGKAPQGSLQVSLGRWLRKT